MALKRVKIFYTLGMMKLNPQQGCHWAFLRLFSINKMATLFLSMTNHIPRQKWSFEMVLAFDTFVHIFSEFFLCEDEETFLQQFNLKWSRVVKMQ